MAAHKQGRNTVVVAQEDIGSALIKACDHDADNDAVLLARAAKIIRKDMLAMKQWFDGSFGSTVDPHLSKHCGTEDSLQGFIQRGGKLGFPPPRSSFPPPKNLRIIIEKSAQ